jgi:hypothetical protein
MFLFVESEARSARITLNNQGFFSKCQQSDKERQAMEILKPSVDFYPFSCFCFPVFDVQQATGDVQEERKGLFLSKPNWDFMLELMKWKQTFRAKIQNQCRP